MTNICTSFSARGLLTASVCMLTLTSCSQPSTSLESFMEHTHTEGAISESNWFPTAQAAETPDWPESKRPTATPGTNVVAFANDLHHPRWLYALPNGDILVAESHAQPQSEAFSLKKWIIGQWMHVAEDPTESQHQITLLRDNDGDGVADERYVFIKDIPAPLGVALVGDTFYIANTKTLLQSPYQAGQTQMTLTTAPAAATPPSAQPKLAKQPIDTLNEMLLEDGVTQGRPANVLLDKHGYLLVADDVGNVIWHVRGNRKVAQK